MTPLPRKQRVWYPGATYHVMSRGNRRISIFKDTSDYIDFLEYLSLVKEAFPFKIHSICLMTNHFHMAIETESNELWKIMHKFLLSYASNYNKKYSLTGHLFENRYTAQLIEDEHYFLEVSRYIHLNPVKAKMVRDPSEYEFSSYDLFVNPDDTKNSSDGTVKLSKKMIGDLVDTQRVLGCFNINGREQYRMFVEGKISHAEQELLIMKDMKEDERWLPW